MKTGLFAAAVGMWSLIVRRNFDGKPSVKLSQGPIIRPQKKFYARAIAQSVARLNSASAISRCFC